MSLTPSVPPSEYATAFGVLSSVGELARILAVTPRELRRYTYGAGRIYQRTKIRKRRGGMRRISRPADGLKILQSKMAMLLSAAYQPRACVHGFVPDQSIATNAAAHEARRWVFNVDLKDFFPSINFGRVRGRLMSRPFGLPEDVATVIAQLCCYENELPQGAPTSPVLSNIVSSGMDANLERLSRRYRCTFTRYADDLTFSTDEAYFPASIGRQLTAHGCEAMVGPSLDTLIKSSGFEVNPEKVRLQRYDTRQIVTGLVVNAFPNVPRRRVRRVRAMLRAWRVHGYDAAEAEYRQYYDSKYRPFGEASFRSVVKGHIDFIGMVRGNIDPIYENLLDQYASLDTKYRVRPRSLRQRNHLQRFEDAVWVIEWQWGMGTGFELEGQGLVTCAHVLRGVDSDQNVTTVNRVEAWQPRSPNLKVGARVKWQDESCDIAVLQLDQPSERPLRVGPRAQLPIGHSVWSAGYPNQTDGAGLWRDAGVITRLDHHVQSPRYTVNFPIIEGASVVLPKSLAHGRSL